MCFTSRNIPKNHSIPNMFDKSEHTQKPFREMKEKLNVSKLSEAVKSQSATFVEGSKEEEEEEEEEEKAGESFLIPDKLHFALSISDREKKKD